MTWFRINDQRTVVYRFFDIDGTLLYVGVTNNPARRITEHSEDKWWFRQIASARFDHYETREDALAAEALAIQAEQPIHNIAAERLRGYIPDRLLLWGEGGRQAYQAGYDKAIAEFDPSELIVQRWCMDCGRSTDSPRGVCIDCYSAGSG